MKKTKVYPDQRFGLQLITGVDEEQNTGKIKSNNETVDITFQNIDYKVETINPETKRKEYRYILKNITGVCPRGQVTAILGGSGAGKTTLLNILACRISKDDDSQLTGLVQANNQTYDFDRFCKFASYVMQHDILMETLTPRETFHFAVKLKFSDSITQRVDEIVKRMKLEKCQNSLIGGITMKGISGGERKRTSIGYELVSNPLCLLLDEPTSGLDSFTAFQIINELKQLAQQKNRTIIFTIHSPSTDIFHLFDRIMLLANGNFIYQGKKTDIIDHFNKIGFMCPVQTNPMDYYLTLMQSDEKICYEDFEKLHSAYEKECREQIKLLIQDTEYITLPLKNQQISIWSQIKIITDRNITCYQRDPMQQRIRIIQTIIQGLLLGGVFWEVANGKNSLKDLSSISGSLFFCVMNLAISSVLSVILTFPIEREIFLREESSKLYSIFSYFIAKQLLDIPMSIGYAILQGLISYWMCKYQNNYESILMHLFISILIYSWSSGLGMVIGCLFSDIKAIFGIGLFTIMPYILFSGFFANPKYFYFWFSWIQYTSPITYSFQALQQIEFKNQIYEVDPIDLYGIEFETWFCIYLLLAFIVLFRLMAFFLLYFLKSKQQ